MKAIVLFSGGKDSTLALYKAKQQGYEVAGLLTVISKNPYSYLFHYPCIELTYLQSEALGINLYTMRTDGDKEKEVEDLKFKLAQLKKELQIEIVVSGVVESEYQKKRIEIICRELGLTSLTPNWNKDSKALIAEMINLGFEIVFTAVAAQGFTEDWLSKKLDEKALKQLEALNRKFGVHLALEGGEGETFILDATFFSKRIKFIRIEKFWDKDSGYIIVKEAKLMSKETF